MCLLFSSVCCRRRLVMFTFFGWVWAKIHARASLFGSNEICYTGIRSYLNRYTPSIYYIVRLCLPGLKPMKHAQHPENPCSFSPINLLYAQLSCQQLQLSRSIPNFQLIWLARLAYNVWGCLSPLLPPASQSLINKLESLELLKSGFFRLVTL